MLFLLLITLFFTISPSTTPPLDSLCLSLHDLEFLKNPGSRPLPSELKPAHDKLLWHYSFPTIGLHAQSQFYPPNYPYTPHFFTLWQLAPSQGHGITVALIDSGAAAFPLINNPHSKHLNLTLPTQSLNQNLALNVVGHNDSDVIEQLVNILRPYIKPDLFSYADIATQAPQWIIDFLCQKTSALQNYLAQKGLASLTEPEGKLSVQGQDLLATITTGPFGFTPPPPLHSLTLSYLEKAHLEKEYPCVTQLLPLPDPGAHHGTHTLGIIAAKLSQAQTKLQRNLEEQAGIHGIAPQASTLMIKAFHNDNTTPKAFLIALKRAILYQADIVAISLKFTRTPEPALQELLEQALSCIPYVIAAAGNDGNSGAIGSKFLSYPACCSSVDFAVGSFDFPGTICPIAPFTQADPTKSNFILAPGVDILSCDNTYPNAYAFKSGTSCSTAIITACVSLVVAEFKDFFSREQILQAIYASCMHMHTDWIEHSCCGTPDIRTALFTLHVLKFIYTTTAKSPKTPNSEVSFEQLLQAMLYLLQAAPAHFAYYSLRRPITFSKHFIDYWCIANTHAKTNSSTLTGYYVPDSLLDAIHYYAQPILLALSNTPTPHSLFNSLFNQLHCNAQLLNYLLKTPTPTAPTAPKNFSLAKNLLNHPISYPARNF
jgi:subtilisin family serine protease